MDRLASRERPFFVTLRIGDLHGNESHATAGPVDAIRERTFAQVHPRGLSRQIGLHNFTGRPIRDYTSAFDQDRPGTQGPDGLEVVAYEQDRPASALRVGVHALQALLLKG